MKKINFLNCGSFKPCYKWNTFNTLENSLTRTLKIKVLNLVISGIPSILIIEFVNGSRKIVLNLVISGIPSIHKSLKTKNKKRIKF